jgi:hypothetical protein
MPNVLIRPIPAANIQSASWPFGQDGNFIVPDNSGIQIFSIGVIKDYKNIYIGNNATAIIIVPENEWFYLGCSDVFTVNGILRFVSETRGDYSFSGLIPNGIGVPSISHPELNYQIIRNFGGAGGRGGAGVEVESGGPPAPTYEFGEPGGASSKNGGGGGGGGQGGINTNATDNNTAGQSGLNGIGGAGGLGGQGIVFTQGVSAGGAGGAGGLFQLTANGNAGMNGNQGTGNPSFAGGGAGGGGGGGANGAHGAPVYIKMRTSKLILNGIISVKGFDGGAGGNGGSEYNNASDSGSGGGGGGGSGGSGGKLVLKVPGVIGSGIFEINGGVGGMGGLFGPKVSAGDETTISRRGVSGDAGQSGNDGQLVFL